MNRNKRKLLANEVFRIIENRNLRKMLFNVCLSIIEQINATVHIGEISNAQTITWVQLGL